MLPLKYYFYRRKDLLPTILIISVLLKMYSEKQKREKFNKLHVQFLEKFYLLKTQP